MRVSLEVMGEASDDLRNIVEIGLADHAASANVAPRHVRALSVVARGDGASVMGALLGRTVWGWLHVSELWVAERYRRKGIGRSLMTAAERAAVERGCYASYLDTFDFQAVSFYELLGYSKMGALEGFPFGHTRFFLQKRLTQVRLNKPPTDCPDRVKAILAALQIPLESIAARSLVFHPEAADLIVAETGDSGKEHLLVPPAASAWRAMKIAAFADGIVISIVSAFRTIDRQAEIVRTKMDKGLSLESILCVSAPPGYSEHHSGRAIDVTTDGVRPLEQEFEHTNAFRWLSTNAGRFGFVLSFPRNNRYGYAYEPWHWCFEVAEA